MSYLEDVINKKVNTEKITKEYEPESKHLREVFSKRLNIGLKCLSNYDCEMSEKINTSIMDKIATILYNINMLGQDCICLPNCTINNIGQYKKFLLDINTILLFMMFSRDKSFLDKIFVKEVLSDEGVNLLSK